VIGYPVCYANLPYLPWDLDKYRLCDNIFGAVVGENRVIFPQRHIFGKPFLKAFYFTSLPGDSTEGDSLTSFDNPRRIIWRLH
jgi:hypothetical protein